MKTRTKVGLLLSGLLGTLPVFADKVVIEGRPIILQSHPGYYTIPPSFSTDKPYRLVRMGEYNRICYLHEKPEFAELNRLDLVIKEKNLTMIWYCYKFDSRYFELDF